MRRPFLRQRLLAIALALLFAVQASSSVLIFTWTGAGNFGDWFDARNWDEGVVPTDGSTVVFGPTPSGSTVIEYASSPYEVHVAGMSFNGITRPFQIYALFGASYIGANGIFYAPAAPITSFINDSIVLKASQAWNIASGTLAIEGFISDFDYNETSTYVSGNYQLEKLGAGTLSLRDDYNADWTGGMKLTTGRLEVHSRGGTSYAFGSGLLTFNGGTLVTHNPDDDDLISLGNAIESNGYMAIENGAELQLTGDILLTGNTTLNVTGKPLHVGGQIHDGDSSFSLTLDSDGIVVLTGSSGWDGGTAVNRGALIFAGEDNTPGISNGISVGSTGYVGITNGQNVGGFLDQVNKSSTGTIGFDSDFGSTITDTFTATVDLSQFTGGIRLGSATRARLLGNIITSGPNYRFGGGGGTLTVASLLTGSRGIVVESHAQAPLTLIVSPDMMIDGSNSFTGGVSATNSAVLFTPASLPPGNTLTLFDGGYIGMIDGAEMTDNFLGMFAAGTNRGMIGFDSVSTVTIPTAISLASFDPGVYLGSTTHAIVTGTITPAADGVIRLGGYKGGILEVASALTGASTQVHIGDPSSQPTFGDFLEEEYSRVVLDGDNSYGGSTLLSSGELRVGQANRTQTLPDDLIGVVPTTALGTGSLIVQPVGFSSPLHLNETLMPMLSVVEYDTIIANPIQLNAPLRLGDSAEFVLSGKITGLGGLDLDDWSEITLSNNTSTFSGGVNLNYQSELTVGADNALGTGMLTFSEHSYVTFVTTNPVVHGLASYDEAMGELFLATPGTALTINQNANTQFSGYIYSNWGETAENTGAARLVKTGSGTLELQSGELDFHRGTPQSGLPEVALEVRQGAVLLRDEFSFSLGTGAIWVNGGRFAMDQVFLSSEIYVSSGALAGSGGIFNKVTIASGALLSPGLGNGDPKLGILTISHLTLNGGGIYEWNIQSPIFDVDAPLQDLIYINTPQTLEIAATSTDRFIIRPISLNADGVNGMMTGLQENQAYSWMLIHYDAVTNPDVSRFTLDMSQFQTNLSGSYALSFVAGAGTSGALFLNFTAVPEPSTYALMGIGLIAIAISACRRRK